MDKYENQLNTIITWLIYIFLAIAGSLLGVLLGVLFRCL